MAVVSVKGCCVEPIPSVALFQDQIYAFHVPASNGAEDMFWIRFAVFQQQFYGIDVPVFSRCFNCGAKE